MKNLSRYIEILKQDAELWDKVKPLVEHIAFLEAELRLAKLGLDDAEKLHEMMDQNNEDPKVIPYSPVKTTKRNQDISLEERNLYRAVGELAFVIAKADNILRDSERKAFHDAIEESFGKNSWIAEDRFQWIERTPTTDVESTYHHVLYLIRQNKIALNDALVEKFIDVICKVAEVANIHERQKEYIDRFNQDLRKIYQEA